MNAARPRSRMGHPIEKITLIRKLKTLKIFFGFMTVIPYFLRTARVNWEL